VRYAIEPAPHADALYGEVIVLLEQGFAAHRTHRSVSVPILRTEIDSLSSKDAGAIVNAAAGVVARLAGNLLEQHFWGEAWDDHPVKQLSDAIDGAHILTVSWPVFRMEASRPAAVRVVVGDSIVQPLLAGDVSTALVDDLQRQYTQVLTRSVGRAIVKYLATRELERKARKEGGETAEFVVGLFANVAANALEQADTRSWSLLPDRISVARLVLPAGSYPVRLELQGADGNGYRVVDLGTVDVEAGRQSFVMERVWGPDVGRERLPQPAPVEQPGSGAVSSR
jgi:hypothetical protein